MITKKLIAKIISHNQKVAETKVAMKAHQVANLENEIVSAYNGVTDAGWHPDMAAAYASFTAKNEIKKISEANTKN